MPKFAILITHNEYLWWKYSLVIEHRPIINADVYPTPEAAFKAALNEANRRGMYTP